jgi:hypothetical protein
MRGERAWTDTEHTLNASIAERSWGAPLVGRSAEVVGVTTELTAAYSDDENAAAGEPVPSAKRGIAAAIPDFGWNSCRFIATRFQLGLRAPSARKS